ncbi:MAG: Na+/H+ antiporter NhaA [Microbacteriaceae bacterium]|nr:Na+/H+ antiporter NhaA [Microbacteriaceae bacterium]
MPKTAKHHDRARSQLGRKTRLFRLGRKREVARVGRFLRTEMVGGIVIMIAALAGFLLANSPLAQWYFELRNTYVGIPELGLKLSLGHWAADGLLAIFFFIVGLELKHEFVRGDLSKFSTAIVPVAAAFGGVAVPALIFTAFNAGTPLVHGWAIPTATDIAFAVAILGLIAPGIPPALRMFLLTLAVVDDLIAIAIIAVVYTGQLQLWALGLALVPIALYGFLTQYFTLWFAKNAWASWLILLPIGVSAWALFLISGVHATIAGVLLAFTVPVRGKHRSKPRLDRFGRLFKANGRIDLASTLAWRYQPLSAGVAVPIFAFFAAGVALSGSSNFLGNPLVWGIILGLVAGKPLGILATTWLVTRFTRAELDPSVTWGKITGVSMLAGVGFTVSLLISELSLKSPEAQDSARLAVMVGSLVAVACASVTMFFQRKR